MLADWTAREQRLADRGGMVFLPDAAGAVPSGGCGLHGLRTLPPRENGGNFDVKQLTRGSRLLLPVYVPGGLFSVGDGHFAQGDGEVCVTAIEVGATLAVRFKLHKGLADSRKVTAPVFSFRQEMTRPDALKSGEVLGAMGMPITDDGEIDGENLTLAARNAVLNMVTLLQERGFSREQAYVICSVAMDLHVSNVVDVPNFVVSALLPEAIFGGD
jgi:formamidase